MSLLPCSQIGTVEILRKRTYHLDNESPDPISSGIVEPGVYPLYEIGDARFWMLDGELNVGGFQKIGNGLFVVSPGDVPSGIPVRFPSRTFSPKAWKELLEHPMCREGDPEQRLRIKLQEGSRTDGTND